MNNLNTSLVHLDAFNTTLNVGDRVIFRTSIRDYMSLGVIASFTPTCARVVFEQWEKNVSKSSITEPKNFPTYNAPKNLIVSVENLLTDPKYVSKWDLLHFPSEFLKQNII